MTTLYRAFASVLFAACSLGILLPSAHPQSIDALPHDDLASDSELRTTKGQGAFLLKPVLENTKQGVDWRHLFEQSFVFLSVEHAFRCATEEGTRQQFSGPFFQGYFNSVGNLHGWNDGDPFIVNYVGHPMQGAVSSRIWTHYDRAYRDIQYPEDAVRGRGTWAY